MTITNGYCTLAQMQDELGQDITDMVDPTKLEASIAAASRQIDAYCGRFFYVNGSVVDRQFYADHPRWVDLSRPGVEGADISSTTGLVVRVDVNGDGTYAQTLTITTDYIVLPANAADEVPARPYTEIQLVTTASAYFINFYNRPGVQITAKFGWPAVPDDITKACLIQTGQLYKAKDAPFGVATFGDMGGLRVGSSMNPIARGLCDPYRKSSFG